MKTLPSSGTELYKNLQDAWIAVQEHQEPDLEFDHKWIALKKAARIFLKWSRDNAF